MIDQILAFVVPAAYALLPPAMNSQRATAFLLAAGLQESRFLERRQLEDGPGRGFWMFEKAGVSGVMRHLSTRALVSAAMRDLRYAREIDRVVDTHAILQDNDVLACVFARLLLWTVSGALPTRDQPEEAWSQYLSSWRPGHARPETWHTFYAEAWDRVELQGVGTTLT